MDLPPSLAWIEVDYPAGIDFKEEQLAKEKPRCSLQRIKLDLADVEARRRMLASVRARGSKILVLTEGVIPYLTTEAVGSLADDLRTLKPVRWWVIDYFASQVLKMRARRMKHRMQNAPFKFEPDDWFGFFSAHGWQCAEMRYLADETKRLQRKIPLPLAALAYFALRQLFQPSRRDAFRKYAGYALLEPR
jgi:O-methyltransferase involved in polyketide biosynthesis